jgi:hypothetical protein
MKDMIQEKVTPYIFHMSWTKNKDNKLNFFQQLGSWYVKKECVGQTVDAIGTNTTGSSSDLVGACCSVEPLLQCHYRDKPSLQRCRDSPAIDKGRGSFW